MLLFGFTIFVSAFLLFQVQPVISKAILPWFGGAAGVWNTCMLFFQAALLGGYTYAHWLQAQPAKRQRQVHLGLLALSLLSLPILPSAAWKPSGNEEPIWRILGLLATTIGLPYFLLSTSSPLLQAWYVRAVKEGVPWRLFALSNGASLMALLTYPVLVEPALSVPQQAWVWSGVYLLFLGLAATAAWRYAADPAASDDAVSTGEAPSFGLRALWVTLAACASILLLGVTTHMTQDVAAIPFLWVIPLAVYLLTFILCFETSKAYHRAVFLPALAVALYKFGNLLDGGSSSLTVAENVALSSAVLFICCMVCHGELAALKPAPRFLTGYYVALSLGGALGGLFVGLLSPLLFNAYYELNIGLWLCAALAAIVTARDGMATAPRKALLLGMLAAVGAYGAWMVKIKKEELGGVQLAVRNFYGHLHVTEYGQAGEAGAARQLVHGQINHGQQLLDPARRMIPSSYFCRTSGAGRASLARKEGVPQKVGILGLGCGALVGYARKEDDYRLYEINPQVFTIARRNFTFLTETPARVTEVLGDGRLALEREEPQNFDLLFMDAFSGDSIPVHLVTREAFSLYARHMKSDAILVVNITNNYLDLKPVVAAGAKHLGKVAIEIEDDPGDANEECFLSHYALVMSQERYAATPEFHANATVLEPTPGFRAWTDAFSNLFAIVRR
ncbi:MAG TPA: fused MFS/spermidine synthase [Bryobacteraceae bacterium]|nr:fused MFS/spermidine synthase [Bryobacteraceae bacterium]